MIAYSERKEEEKLWELMDVLDQETDFMMSGPGERRKIFLWNPSGQRCGAGWKEEI